MGYVVAGILVLLLLGGFITYLVMQATRRSSPAIDAEDDARAPGIGADASAFGDTEQHNDEHPDAPAAGRAARPDGTPDGRFKRDPIGGEAEGESAVGADPPKPGV